MTTPDVETFIETFQTLMMASLTPEGEPHASTAPYVRMGNDFYLFISTVAQHGRNLLASGRVSLFFAEDECHCSQPFARKRVTIDASVAEVPRIAPEYPIVIERFKARFDPELVASLTQMGDFHLFKLSALGGSVVIGFGKAYRLDENLEVVTHITGHHQRGHSRG